MVKQSYKLIVQDGTVIKKSYTLLANTVILGRDPMSDVVLNDPEISRHHARLIRNEEHGGYSLQDMGSTNGSFIEGKRLGGEMVPLVAGQSMKLGSHMTLIYLLDEMAAPLEKVEDPTFVPPFNSLDMDGMTESAPPLPPFESDIDFVHPFVTKESNQARRPAGKKVRPKMERPFSDIPDPPKDKISSSMMVFIVVGIVFLMLCILGSCFILAVMATEPENGAFLGEQFLNMFNLIGIFARSV